MSKLAKFIVLAGGVLGLLGFFLPLFTVSHKGFKAQFTTFSLVQGIDRVEDHVEVVKGTEIDDQPEIKAALVEVNKKLAEVRPFFYALFMPAALLFLFAVMAIAKARMGRLLGFFSILVGAGGVTLWFLLQTAVTELSKDQADFAGGVGMHAILVSGGLGFFAGLVALFAPERGYQVSKRHAATLSTRAP